jgi:hypothetical protein
LKFVSVFTDFFKITFPSKSVSSISLILSLVHTYPNGGASAICDITGTDQIGMSDKWDYLDDLYGSIPATSCPSLLPTGANPPTGGQCNNIMGGAGLNNNFTPEQTGLMQRALSFLTVRNYVKAPWAISSDIRYVRSSQIWDFDIRLYQYLSIVNTGSLTVGCALDCGPLSVPIGATLSVPVGATLISRSVP